MKEKKPRLFLWLHGERGATISTDAANLAVSALTSGIKPSWERANIIFGSLCCNNLHPLLSFLSLACIRTANLLTCITILQHCNSMFFLDKSSTKGAFVSAGALSLPPPSYASSVWRSAALASAPTAPFMCCKYRKRHGLCDTGGTRRKLP